MDDLDVLLTNDDGIDSTGFHALYEELDDVGTVTAVAPAEDQSAVGRAISRSVTVHEHELGYVIDGTPVDCVVAGLSSLVPDADVVIAGCNRGANVGSSVLGRSGTVSAAVEAAFFDVPAIAVSMFIPVKEYTPENLDVPAHQYREAVRATSYLAKRAFDAGVFDHADYLNVNAPVTDRATGEMVITRPSHVYCMDATRDGDTIKLENPIWEMMVDGDTPDPEGTDRWAILQNKVSVSPLTAPHSTQRLEKLDALARQYPDRQ